MDYDKYETGQIVAYHTVRNGKLEVRQGIIHKLLNVTPNGKIKMYLMENGDRAMFSEIEKSHKKHKRRAL